MDKDYSWLYKFAWGYEILAAIIGVTMALVFNSQAYIDAQKDGNIDAAEFTGLVAGTLPFLMVAAAELCKIPLVTAVMRARNFLWKILFTIVVSLASLITFETVSVGLESANAIRGKPLTELNQSIEAKQRNIKILQNNTKEVVRTNAEKMREQVNNTHDKRIIGINDEIKKINNKYDELLRAKVQPLKNRVNTIKEQQSNKRQARTNQIVNAENAINSANKRIIDANIALGNCMICTKEEENIKSAETALESANTKLFKAENISIEGDNEIQDMQQKITDYENEIAIEKDKKLIESNNSLTSANDLLKRALSDIDKSHKNEIKKISTEQVKIRAIQSEINDIRSKKALVVNDNLVYRLAGKFYGKDAGDVEESDAAFVGNLFAITIGLLVAIIGPFIVIAYLVLTNQHENSRPIFRNLASAIHMLARAILTKKRKPTIRIEKVEKIKEVPVEKIVIKHVPIYTDDKSLVQLTNEYSENNTNV